MQLATRALCQASLTTMLFIEHDLATRRKGETSWLLQVGTDTWRAGILVDTASANVPGFHFSFGHLIGTIVKLSYSLQHSPSSQNYKFPFRGAKWCLGMYDKDECLPFVRVPSPTFQISVDSLAFLLGCLPLCNAVRWCEFTENDGAQGVFAGKCIEPRIGSGPRHS